jgi:hypothetical protein
MGHGCNAASREGDTESKKKKNLMSTVKPSVQWSFFFQRKLGTGVSCSRFPGNTLGEMFNEQLIFMKHALSR